MDFYKKPLFLGAVAVVAIVVLVMGFKKGGWWNKTIPSGTGTGGGTGAGTGTNPYIVTNPNAGGNTPTGRMSRPLPPNARQVTIIPTDGNPIIIGPVGKCGCNDANGNWSGIENHTDCNNKKVACPSGSDCFNIK